MFYGSNSNRKSKLSELLTEPLNPRGLETYLFLIKKNLCHNLVTHLT